MRLRWPSGSIGLRNRLGPQSAAAGKALVVLAVVMTVKVPPACAVSRRPSFQPVNSARTARGPWDIFTSYSRVATK